jgi:hypothetical protein
LPSEHNSPEFGGIKVRVIDLHKTLTLCMSGEKDFNVPTELIIYPGQFNGISIPSYKRDRFDRWLARFGKYL